jgi:Thiamine pyrophosphate enzyme, C-terminal TPP binding domain/AMP-binding enzyme
MILGFPESVKRKLSVESVTKLLISSAPARQDTKLALMEYFRRSRLYEGYGSTEAGWVTLLRPEEQLTKLGSIGRECLGTGRIKLLDSEGNEVIDGEVGELYSRTPYAFQGYWKSSEKTAEAFRGAYCTVGDMARRDQDGYYYLAEASTWSESARYIQADATPTRIGLHVPAEVAMVGDAKLILRQLSDAARANDRKRLTQSNWLQDIADVRTNFDRVIVEQEHNHHDDIPIHPARVARELCEVIDPDATIVIDSFTMSGWMSQWFHARFPGQILDAGPLAPVGHGVGMAIGAQLARPRKQVVLIIGDGGLGVSGSDLETARRYGLSIVAVLWNNSSWGPSFDEMPFLKGRTDPFEILPNQRYDRMFELMDCYGEHVERPEDFRPALERALGQNRRTRETCFDIGERSAGPSGEAFAIKPAACRILPLRLGRQAFTGPF